MVLYLLDGYVGGQVGNSSTTKRLKSYTFKSPINLYCFTDVHIGAKDHDKDKFDKAVKALKADPNGYCFFNGDNLEFTPGGHHGATNEQIMSNTDQINEFVSLVKELGKKVLFFRTGNHEARAADLCDVHIYDVLAKTLKVPELHRGMEEVHFKVGKTKIRLVSTHGEGGNSKRALSNMQQAFPGADVYFTGHTHELYAEDTKQWIDTSSGEEIQKCILSIAGGSFLKWADYARGKNMIPTQTGCYILRFDENGASIKGRVK